MSISCAPIASSSSRTTCSTFWCTRQPAGIHDHRPVPTCRTSPARTSSLCDSASASAGGCFSVGSRYWLSRVIGAKSLVIERNPKRFESHREVPMAYEVPPLPYDYDALEPHIDEQTMRIHHDKHHQAYVDKANAALDGTDWDGKP